MNVINTYLQQMMIGTNNATAKRIAPTTTRPMTTAIIVLVNVVVVLVSISAVVVTNIHSVLVDVQ